MPMPRFVGSACKPAGHRPSSVLPSKTCLAFLASLSFLNFRKKNCPTVVGRRWLSSGEGGKREVEIDAFFDCPSLAYVSVLRKQEAGEAQSAHLRFPLFVFARVWVRHLPIFKVAVSLIAPAIFMSGSGGRRSWSAFPPTGAR